MHICVYIYKHMHIIICLHMCFGLPIPLRTSFEPPTLIFRRKEYARCGYTNILTLHAVSQIEQHKNTKYVVYDFILSWGYLCIIKFHQIVCRWCKKQPPKLNTFNQLGGGRLSFLKHLTSMSGVLNVKLTSWLWINCIDVFWRMVPWLWFTLSMRHIVFARACACVLFVTDYKSRLFGAKAVGSPKLG